MSNHIFPVKTIKNINGNLIRWQSKPELKLVNFCNENNILIENGPIVYFFFKNKKRKYHIDYYIPDKNLIIEIKDNHIWHQQQIKMGKWILKENAAIEHARENGLTYKLLFSQHLNEFLNSTFKI